MPPEHFCCCRPACWLRQSEAKDGWQLDLLCVSERHAAELEPQAGACCCNECLPARMCSSPHSSGARAPLQQSLRPQTERPR